MTNEKDYKMRNEKLEMRNDKWEINNGKLKKRVPSLFREIGP